MGKIKYGALKLGEFMINILFIKFLNFGFVNFSKLFQVGDTRTDGKTNMHNQRAMTSPWCIFVNSFIKVHKNYGVSFKILLISIYLACLNGEKLVDKNLPSMKWTNDYEEIIRKNIAKKNLMKKMSRLEICVSLYFSWFFDAYVIGLLK